MPGSSLSRHLESGVDPGNEVALLRCGKSVTRTMSVYLNIVALGLAIFGIHYWLNNKTYIFEAEDIARIAKRQARKGEICMYACIIQPNHDSFDQSSKRSPV